MKPTCLWWMLVGMGVVSCSGESLLGELDSQSAISVGGGSGEGGTGGGAGSSSPTTGGSSSTDAAVEASVEDAASEQASEAGTVIPCVTSVAMGQRHSCAALKDGSVWCWGAGMLGQLGMGTTWWATVPTILTSIADVRQISGTDYHNCALKVDGTVWCWGKNEYGSWEVPGIPEQVTSLSGTVESLSAGQRHTCARMQNGSAWCFGDNYQGQLGNGSTTDTSDSDNSNAAQVIGLEGGIVSLSSGGWHACAAKQDGSVWCWGDNGSGQLGDGSPIDPGFTHKAVPTPVRVTQLQGAVEVVAGGSHSCARKTDGSAWCWGANFAGQLGDGTLDNSSLPVMVQTLGYEVQQLTAGEGHTCAVKTDGSIWCWGANRDGQLGDGTTDTWGRWSVEPVLGLPARAVFVQAGNFNTCAALVDGSLWCWGTNEDYQLGNGTQVALYPGASPVPTVALVTCP